ncbi:hypothetical protein HM002_00065 [Candidatus Bathyarchaeota archaeon A05DMB-4]|nr:hypothetical protein [Candidatus Bathyarchaeota archaeon A05DMB-4]
MACTQYSISLHGSSNNLFHHNFINNTPSVRFPNLCREFWNNRVESNYWSDYAGVDANHDGIGDTPYMLNAENQNNYPLVNVYIAGDYNHDDTVNMSDADMVELAWQSRRDNLNYNAHVDFNMDGIINIKDATIIGMNWQKHV